MGLLLFLTLFWPQIILDPPKQGATGSSPSAARPLPAARLRAFTHGAEDASTATSRIKELLIKLINQSETMMQFLQTVILKLVNEQR